jgi:hypothetical protein
VDAIGWVTFLAALGLVIHLNWEWRLTRGWQRFRQPAPPAGVDVAVDVVMCVRNGEGEVADWFEAMMSQDQITLHITIVDDGSTDSTPEILSGLAARAPHTLRTLRIENTRPGKKDALQAGIDGSAGPFIWLTDVDCRPASPTAVSRILAPLASNKADIVLGTSLPRLDHPPAILPLIDGLRVARTYIGWAGEDMPYMAVGRNWAFRRALWPGVEAHAGRVASGDDDLTLQEMMRTGASEPRVMALFEREAQMDTRAPASRRAAARAKRRHLTTGAHYPPGVVFLLALPSLAAGCWALAWMVALGQSSEVLHTAVWIAGVAGGAMWSIHALTFRSFARACGIRTRLQWLGWLQPLVWFWLVYQTALSTAIPRQQRGEGVWS